MSSPRVSIGMPLYNAQRYLSEAFDSLRCRDYKDIEIVFSDNASTDRTWEICQYYAQADGRVRLHSQRSDMGAAKLQSHSHASPRGNVQMGGLRRYLCAVASGRVMYGSR